ncbi:MAG: DMT family transporter [Monoglobales bacterium]
MSKGKICLILSAFVYGILPVLAKLSYSGGANSITLTFLRAAMTLPVLFFLLKAEKKSLKLTKRQLIQVIILGVFGGALPIILLYISYDFIPAGLATTLHFIYPLVIVFADALLYHEKMSKLKLLAVVLVTIGIFMFADINMGGAHIGIAAAILSGIFYSFFVIYIDRSGLGDMDYIKLTFYMLLIMSAATLSFGVIVHGINFDMSASSWWMALIISALSTLIALPLFQAGVRYEGASTAGIMSAFEPVTSIAAGALFLGEYVGLMQIFGAAIIILGIGLVEYERG